MYDCSKEFNKFYRTKVVLPAKEQNELRKKRKLNIKRLKDGLIEYNEEKNKDYKIAEERIQGSMANDENQSLCSDTKGDTLTLFPIIRESFKSQFWNFLFK